jgi:hypothetical protein
MYNLLENILIITTIWYYPFSIGGIVSMYKVGKKYRLL